MIKTSTKSVINQLILLCNFSVITNAFYNGIHLTRTTSKTSPLFWNHRISTNTNHYPFINKPFVTKLYSSSQQEATKTASTIGTLVSYETSTNGNNGIAIVKLNIEKDNTSSLGDDYTGRSIQFYIYNPNDDSKEIGIINGVVLIQRTPYLFIYYLDNDNHNLFTSSTTLDSIQVKLSSKQSIYYDIQDGTNVVDYPTLLFPSGDSRYLCSNTPNVSEIELINDPCLTGFTSIDTLCPIGRGQNMLFISNNETMKRNVIYDIMSTQLETKKMKIIYGSTLYKGHEKQVVLGDLIDRSLLDDLLFVTSEDNEIVSYDDVDCVVSAAEGICIALSSCSIGELYARNSDITPNDVLVIIDTIHPFKILWDYTSKYLLQLQGDEEMDEEKAMIASKSSDSEMRSYFSNIIQRSCNLKHYVGGGSLSLLLFVNEPTNPLSNSQDDDYSFTMEDFEESVKNNDKLKARIQLLLNKNIPLTISNCQKLDIPIPNLSKNDDATIKYIKYKASLKFIDDLISMSDGQIYLDNSKQKSSFKLPNYPPINIQKSLTRIGIGKDTVCRADAKIIQKISSGLRLELLYALDNFEDLTEKKRIRYQAYLNIMEQSNDGNVRSLVDSVILILAVKLGFMDVYVHRQDDLFGIQKDLLQHVKGEESTKGVLKTIQDTYDFSNDVEDEKVLNDCITAFFSSRVT